MTDNNHPITPPLELVQKLADGPGTWLEKISKAYCAGADQGLAACVKWLKEQRWEALAIQLRAALRPKPPSLKEQGREALRNILAAVTINPGGRELDVLKEIVESLPD